MVELTRIELVTFRLRRTLSNLCGASEDRTRDLLHAMQTLSQLSYGPLFCFNQSRP